MPLTQAQIDAGQEECVFEPIAPAEVCLQGRDKLRGKLSYFLMLSRIKEARKRRLHGAVKYPQKTLYRNRVTGKLTSRAKYLSAHARGRTIIVPERYYKRGPKWCPWWPGARGEVVGGAGTTPSMVQYIGGPSGGANAYSSLVFRYRDPTGTGNFLMLAGQYGNNASVTPTVSDDVNGSWTVSARVSGSGQTLFYAYFPNSAAGARTVTVTYTGANANGVNHAAGEWNNIVTSSPVASTNTNTGTGATAITCGSVTPSQADDLIIAIAEADSTGTTASWTPGTTNPGVNWQSFYSDRATQGGGFPISMQVQWATCPNVTAINPAITSGTATNYAAMAVIFKAAATATGTPDAPNTLRVGASLHFNCPSYNTGQVFQIPMSGNCLVVAMAYPPAAFASVTAVSDSLNGSWTHLGSVGDPGPNAVVDIYIVTNALTSSSMTMTHTTNGNVTQQNMCLYGVTGAHPNPIDTTCTVGGGGTRDSNGFIHNNGNNSTSNNPTTVFTVAPTQAASMVIVAMQNDSPMTRSCSGFLLPDICWAPEESTNNELDENNGEGHGYFTDTSSQSITFTNVSGAGGIGGWSAGGVVLNAAPPDITGSPQRRASGPTMRI